MMATWEEYIVDVEKKAGKAQPNEQEIAAVKKSFVDNGLLIPEQPSDLKECDFETMNKPEAMKTLAIFRRMVKAIDIAAVTRMEIEKASGVINSFQELAKLRITATQSCFFQGGGVPTPIHVNQAILPQKLEAVQQMMGHDSSAMAVARAMSENKLDFTLQCERQLWNTMGGE